jgi:hypothetical protein
MRLRVDDPGQAERRFGKHFQDERGAFRGERGPIERGRHESGLISGDNRPTTLAGCKALHLSRRHGVARSGIAGK